MRVKTGWHGRAVYGMVDGGSVGGGMAEIEKEWVGKSGMEREEKEGEEI